MNRLSRTLKSIYNLISNRGTQNVDTLASSALLIQDTDITSETIESSDWYLSAEDVNTLQLNFQKVRQITSEHVDNVSYKELLEIKKVLRSYKLKKQHSSNLFRDEEVNFDFDYCLEIAALPIDLSYYTFIQHEIAIAYREINKALKKKKKSNRKQLKNLLFSAVVKSRILVLSFVRPKGNKYPSKFSDTAIGMLFGNLSRSYFKNEEERSGSDISERRLCFS